MMYASELKEILINDPEVRSQFGGVCSADELPNKVQRRPRLYVVNSDKREQPGTHWMLFYFPKKGPSELFDSLGRAPNFYHGRFKTVLMKNGPKYVYNNKNSAALGINDLRTLSRV